MITGNVRNGSDCPVATIAPKFFIEAACDIKTERRVIRSGEFLLIDPSAAPNDGSYVLNGQRVEPWRGQTGIKGVVTKICSSQI